MHSTLNILITFELSIYDIKVVVVVFISDSFTVSGLLKKRLRRSFEKGSGVSLQN